MKRTLFWSMFGPQLAVLLLCLATLGGYSWFSSQRAYRREQRHVLGVHAGLAGRLALRDDGALKSAAALQQLCDALWRDEGVRLTVLRPDGVVLADSSAESASLLSHSDRPEIVVALRDGSGHSERYSVTLRDRLNYVARRVDGNDGKPLAVVRVSGTQRALLAPLRRAQRFFAVLLVCLGIAALALSYLLALRVTHPVAEMCRGLRRLGAGDLDHRLRVPAIPHLAALAREANEMGARLQAQVRATEAERALLDGVLAGMREGVLALDGRKHVVMLNAAARRLVQIDSRKVEDLPLESAVHCADLLALVDSAQNESGTAEAEIHPRGPAATTKIWAATAPWRAADGARAGTLVVLSDMTRIRRLERIRRDFVANVSHELRTPVTAIKGFAETLLEQPPADASQVRRFLGIIRRQAEQVEAILADMLMLARLEDEEKPIPRETVRVQALLQQACALCADQAAARQVKLVCEAPAELTLQGHERLLEQALVNLIDNAIKYGGAGKQVEVGAKREGDAVVLQVRDHGPGIAVEQVERVFERFYRVDAGRGRESGGSGLGLAVVKHVVSVHGGTVSIRNAAGGGCLLIISVPLEQPPQPPQPPHP